MDILPFKHSKFITAYGAPASGKTHLAKFIIQLYYELGFLQWLNVITGSPDDWEGLPEECIVSNTAECRDRFAKTLEEIKKTNPKRKLENLNDDTDPILWYMRNLLEPFGAQIPGMPGVLVLDDLSGDYNFKEKEFVKLFTRYRHYCKRQKTDKEGLMTVVLLSHYAKLITPVVRQAITDCAVFAQTGDDSVKAIFAAIGSYDFGNTKEWTKYLNANTDMEARKFIWFSKKAAPGWPAWQPVICPELPPLSNIFAPQEEEEQPLDKKRKRQDEDTEDVKDPKRPC